MISPAKNAVQANEVLNHPEVYPWVAGPHKGPLDVSGFVDHPNGHLLFSSDTMSLLFVRVLPGIYELHSAVTPEGRGFQSKRFGDEAIGWIFTHTDSCEILTKCPQHNIAASAAAKIMGFVYEWTTRPLWPVESNFVCHDIYSLTIERWNKSCIENVRTGHEFHDELHGQYAKKGMKIDVHGEDKDHDRFAGACFRMIEGGQVNKGINFYNRWAVMSGYEVIGIESFNPLVIDIKEAKLRINTEGFEVI